MSSNEGGWRVPLVGHIAGVDRTDDKVTNIQVKHVVRPLIAIHILKRSLQNAKLGVVGQLNCKIIERTEPRYSARHSIEDRSYEDAHLSYSFASFSPKHSKFSSLSSENSSCRKSGEVDAPKAESASVRE